MIAVALAVLVGLSVFTTSAYAHASPHVLDVVFREDGGYVLLTNRGLIFGDKARASWRLMCSEALGINTSEVPSLVAVPDGGLLVATSGGLRATHDDGCTWQPVAPFGDVATPSLVRDPREPHRLYLSAYTAEPELKLGGLHVSEDGGAHWKLLLAADERDYIRSIRIAPSDPKRIYAAGQTWDMSGKYSYYLKQSRDGGKTWEHSDVPLQTQELELHLFEVSPQDPELVTFRVASSEPMTVPERLLVSRDGGKTFEHPLSMLLLSQLSFSADGTKVWVVGQEGFFESVDGLKTFNRIGPALSMSYVVEHQSQVLACGYYTGYETFENGIGTATAPQDGFKSFMQLSEVKNPVACDASSMTATVCATWWLDWERELGAGQFAADGGGTGGASGRPDAGGGGSDAGSAGGAAGSRAASSGTPEPKSRSGSGCSIRLARGAETGGGSDVVAAVCLLAWLVKRRRH